MKTLLIFLFVLVCAPSVDAQQLNDLRPLKRVRVFVGDSIHSGEWVGIRDSVAGVSRRGTLISVSVASIDSLQVFKSTATSMAIGLGGLIGFPLAVYVGVGLGSDCGKPSCAPQMAMIGTIVFVFIGGAAALLGTMVGSTIGDWHPYYRR